MTGRAIGLVTPAWPGHGVANGIVSAMRELTLGLRAAGHRPVVLSSNLDGTGPADIPTLRIAPPRFGSLARMWMRLGDVEQPHVATAAAIAEAVTQAVDSYGIEALLVEETHGWAGLVQNRVAIPVIAILHGPWFLHRALQHGGGTVEDMHREKREARGLQRVAGILAPSAAVMTATRAAVALPPDKPMAVVPNALDPGDPPGLLDATVLFVGRFDHRKGGDTVLAAWARLAGRRPEARMVFAGPDKGVSRPGAPPLHLPEALAALPAQAREAIHAVGQLDRAAVAALRARHGIALIASRYETFGYTVLEAMAAGQAIISTDAGGPGEILRDGETGLLVPPEDPEAMAAALERLIADPDFARRLGAAARAAVLRNYAPEVIARQTIAFIDTLPRRRP